MTVLWINLAIVFILSFFSRYFATATAIGTFSYPKIRPNKLLVLLVMLTFITVSGLRSGIGDTYFYKHIYEMNDFSWQFIFSQKDIGFGIFQRYLKKYCSSDPQILILTTAIITNVLIISVLYKYSRLFELSIYVYITGGEFLVTMNGMRQCLAAAIIFAATKFIIDGNCKGYILVVLFASTFHESALILIPIYFLVRTKAWSKNTFLLLFLSIVIALGFDKFSSVLFSAIKDTQYSVYQNSQEGGANIIRVLVDGIPIAISYFGREKLRRIFPISDIFVNMSIIGFVFMVISTRNWIFARFDIYFNLYQLILISWIIKVFRDKDQKVIYYLILVCYLGYYFYEDVIALGIIYKSAYFKL
ncbi:EpsG family protein [Neobacillus sp. PS3-12]|uniref:EpsG family protein n=1 Tax=Neobacillus sp. PS3-12 TaxID=3070677 RepID=UPI0027DEE925|nr:EpsG family protein [Neobacillus sp. PS3-12]WML51588.1 EpsG family protein [Neobacillus sp. PS3-12]